MRLESHVGGLSISKKVAYLEARGWRREGGQWLNPVPETDPVNLKWAVHHQLTVDLCEGMARFGWRVVDYSPRGYARLIDPQLQENVSLPEALRRQARRLKQLVRPFTVDLLGASWHSAAEPEAR